MRSIVANPGMKRKNIDVNCQMSSRTLIENLQIAGLYRMMMRKDEILAEDSKQDEY